MSLGRRAKHAINPTMRVRFRTRRLERCFEDSSRAARTWGPEVGERYVERIRYLIEARSAADLYKIRTLDFHALTGDRAGQHAMRLTGRWRLIVTLTDDDAALVDEVVDYH